MTNDELIALKKLALKAKPFDASEGPKTWDELTQEEHARAQANGEFFLTVHSILPELIDELLELREAR